MENREFRYLPTEEEKVSFFTKTLQIPLTDLPVKIYKTPNSKTETHRFFVDKFPLYVTNLSTTAPVVHFSYVDPEPFGSAVDFANHLRSYAVLFNHLQEFRLIYIYQASPKCKHAEKIFQTFVRTGFKLRVEDLELSKFFNLRRAWESQEYEKLGSSELLFLNQARRKFSDPRYETLYSQWQEADSLSPLSAECKSKDVAVKATFVGYKIKANYSAFGDLD